MGFLDRLNKKIVDFESNYIDTGATDDDIKRLKKLSPIDIPEDYIELLKEIGDGTFYSIWGHTICLISVEDIEGFYQDYTDIEEKDTLIIGNDLGGMVLFYGYGHDGFGIYCSSLVDMSYEESHKICDSITELLVEGKGIDTIFYGHVYDSDVEIPEGATKVRRELKPY
jgi:hypothetical protein